LRAEEALSIKIDSLFGYTPLLFDKELLFHKIDRDNNFFALEGRRNSQTDK